MQNMRKNRAAQNYMGNNAYLKLYDILVLKFFKRAFGIQDTIHDKMLKLILSGSLGIFVVYGRLAWTPPTTAGKTTTGPDPCKEQGSIRSNAKNRSVIIQSPKKDPYCCPHGDHSCCWLYHDQDGCCATDEQCKNGGWCQSDNTCCMEGWCGYYCTEKSNQVCEN